MVAQGQRRWKQSFFQSLQEHDQPQGQSIDGGYHRSGNHTPLFIRHVLFPDIFLDLPDHFIFFTRLQRIQGHTFYLRGTLFIDYFFISSKNSGTSEEKKSIWSSMLRIYTKIYSDLF